MSKISPLMSADLANERRSISQLFSSAMISEIGLIGVATST